MSAFSGWSKGSSLRANQDTSALIRTAPDTPSICKLLSQLGYPLDETEVHARLASLMGRDEHLVLVAELKGSVVGMLHAFDRGALEKPREAVVQALVVDSEVRGAGVGAALMKKAEAWAAHRGLTSTVLYTRVDRDKARTFYERLGYRVKATSHLMGRG